MILASSSLSSLGCWQLLVIRGLARVFLRAASRLTRTSRRLALDSHFASLRACLRSTEKRKKIMPVRSPYLGSWPVSQTYLVLNDIRYHGLLIIVRRGVEIGKKKS